MQEFLSPTEFIDSDAPSVIEFAHSHAKGGTARERAVNLYYAVRDSFKYDPYRIKGERRAFKASGVLERKYGFCIPKAELLAAAARVVGIPSRLGFADVRNHLTSKRLREMMQTDIFYFHGFTELYIDEKWVKATPAFNKALCEKAGILPLEFDGTADSVFHPYDAKGERHMEYVEQRGSFADLPFDLMISVFVEKYPVWSKNFSALQSAGSFESEALTA